MSHAIVANTTCAAKLVSLFVWVFRSLHFAHSNFFSHDAIQLRETSPSLLFEAREFLQCVEDCDGNVQELFRSPAAIDQNQFPLCNDNCCLAGLCAMHVKAITLEGTRERIQKRGSDEQTKTLNKY